MNGRNESLYSIRPDGSRLRRLTTRSGSAEYPAWSPDGSMIAFSTHTWRGTGIHVMAADGSNLHRVSFVPNEAGMAPDTTRLHAWSPDGQQIAYVITPLTRIGVVAELWVVRTDGTKPKRLYRSEAYPEDISRPTWSPDGDYIALAIRLLDRPRNSGLFVVRADGTRLRKVASAATDPVWQPSQ
jgi:TolB protein